MIQDRYVGFVGEIVFCRERGLRRLYRSDTLVEGLPDAYGPNNERIEIKTRTGYYAFTIPVQPCDQAYLLLSYVDAEGQERIGVVYEYDKLNLQSHSWKMIITKKIWNLRLQKGAYQVPESYLAKGLTHT